MKPCGRTRTLREERRERQARWDKIKTSRNNGKSGMGDRPVIPVEPDLELTKISKEVLVYEMQKAGYTDLDIKEQTGLSWDEIKRLKAGGKREYQKAIDERIKRVYWEIHQEGFEAGERENNELRS